MSLIIVIGAMRGRHGLPPPVDNFSSVIQFAEDVDMGTHTVDAPITFTKNTSGQLAGKTTIGTLIADGVNIPDLSAFTIAGWSSGYDNTEGAQNDFEFLYDGTYYWVGISQP